MALTLSDIVTAVGRKCTLLDSGGNFVDGLVGESDVVALANLRWREIHGRFADKYPEGLVLEVTKDLVANTSDYAINDVGQTVYTLPYVGIKYASTDTTYRKVRRKKFNELFGTSVDTSIYSSTTPFYMAMPLEVAAVSPSLQTGVESAIRIVPTPTAAVTDGLYLRIVEEPDVMIQDGDTPYTLPDGAQSLIIDYVIADVWEMKRDWANSNEALNRAVMNEKNFFASYQPETADEPVTYNTGKVYNPYSR